MNTDTVLCQADSVLDFWFADGLARGWPTLELKQRWYGGDAPAQALVVRTLAVGGQ